MKRLWRAERTLHKKLLLLPILVTAASFLVGTLLSILVLKIAADPTVPMFGTGMALIGFLVYPFIYGREFAASWTLAGSMGIPRKTFLRYCLLRQLVLTAVSGILLLGLDLAEVKLSAWLGLQKPLEFYWLLQTGPALCLAFAMLQLILGILYQHTQVVYWIYLDCIWLGGFLIKSEMALRWAAYCKAILIGTAGLVILAGIYCLWYGSRKLDVK